MAFGLFSLFLAAGIGLGFTAFVHGGLFLVMTGLLCLAMLTIASVSIAARGS